MEVIQHLGDTPIVLPPPCGHPACAQSAYPLIVEGAGFLVSDLN